MIFRCCYCNKDCELNDYGSTGVSGYGYIPKITDNYRGSGDNAVYYWNCNTCGDPIDVCASCIDKDIYLCSVCKRDYKIKNILNEM